MDIKDEKQQQTDEALETAENDAPEKVKKHLSDEVKQNIAGLAVIGIITVGLCITGIIGGRNGGDKIPVADSSSAALTTVYDSSSDIDSDSSSSSKTTTTSSKQSESDTSSDSSAEETTASETSAETEPAPAEPPAADPPAAPPATDPPAAPPAVSPNVSGGLSAKCEVSNEWDSQDGHCMQVNISVQNGTSSEKSGWTVTMTVPNGTGIESSWNGNFSVNGSTITITPVDYNSTISAGGQVSDVGLIVKSPSEFTPSASVQ